MLVRTHLTFFPTHVISKQGFLRQPKFHVSFTLSHQQQQHVHRGETDTALPTISGGFKPSIWIGAQDDDHESA